MANQQLFNVPIGLPADPTLPLQAVTKQYVDAVASLDGGSFLDNYLVGGVSFDGGAYVATPVNNNIAFVRSATGTGNSTLTGASTGGISTNASGSTFLVVVATYGSSVPGTLTVTDNKSNTYTQVLNVRYATDGMTMRAFVCVGGAGGSGHVWTLATNNQNYCAIAAVELTGVALLDATTPVTTSVTAATVTTGSFTAANAISAIIGVCTLDANAFPAPASATSPATLYVTVPGSANNVGIGVSYQLVTTIAAKTAAFTGGGTTLYMNAGVFALKST